MEPLSSDVPNEVASEPNIGKSSLRSSIVETRSEVHHTGSESPILVEDDSLSFSDPGDSISSDEVTIIEANEVNVGPSNSCVTEEEIKASLAKKEENLDLLSLSGNSADGSLSELSTLTKISTFDEAISNRQSELINSIRSRLDTSCLSIDSADLNNEQPLNISTSTVINSTVVCSDDGSKSHQETVPPAALFKPSFSLSETNPLHDSNLNNVNNKTQFEDAMASLTEILSNPNPDSILDLYSSKLEAYKEEDNKKFAEFFSKIDNEKKSFLSLAEDDPIGELEDQLKFISGVDKSIASTTGENNVVSSTNDETLVPSEPTHIESEPSKEDIQETTQISAIAAIKDKDSEFLIEGDDENIEENFDEDELLASDDEQSADAVPPSSANELNKGWQDFVSLDEDENRDNNDPKWDYLRNLGNDYERYKAVQARWNNAGIPNPKRDLTCRCRNVNHSRTYTGNWPRQNEYGKRLLSSPDADRRHAKRPRRESCTVLFDWNIQELIRHVENQRHQIEMEQEERVTRLADQQRMDQMMAQRERKSELFLQQMKQRHVMEAETLVKEFQRRRNELTGSARLKMEALRKASEEVRQFHEFYPNENNMDGTNDVDALIYLTETEVEEIIEVENMLMGFGTFYLPRK